MTTKTTKTIIFAAIMLTLVIPLTSFNMVDATQNNVKGIDRIKFEKSSTEIPLQHERLQELDSKLMSAQSKTAKIAIEKQMKQIETENVRWFEDHTDKIKMAKALGKQDLLTDTQFAHMQENGIDAVFNVLPMTGSDYDYVDNALEVHIDPKYFEDANLTNYIEKIRSVIGDEIDLTLSPKEADVTQTCAGRESNCDPIQGGVEIGVQLTGANNYKDCGVGIAATYQSMDGFITAGHCGDGLLTHHVNQQAGTSGNDVGTVKKETYWGNTKCDCAFVESTYDVVGVYETTNPNTTAAPFVGMTVTMSGAESGIKTGTVNSVSYTAYYAADGYYVKELIRVPLYSQVGDSGSSVVSGSAFVGIVSGGTTNHTDMYFVEPYWIEYYFGGITWGV